MSSNQYLLRIAGINIYSSIKDTEQLSVYRGASLLLKQVIVDFIESANDFEIDTLKRLSSGASEGLFSIQVDNSIDTSIQLIKTWLAEHPAYQYFTFVVEAVDYNGQNFRQANERLIALCRFSQMKQFSLALPDWNNNPAVHVCAVDRIKPAVIVKSKPCPADQNYCSASVSSRFMYGREQRQAFYADQTGLRELEFTDELSEITEDTDNNKGNLANKLALIYFDGNGFGAIQAGCMDENELKQFDRYIQQKRKEFLKAFIEKISTDKDFKNGNKIRLEVLLWGGDELTLVVPAWKGLEVVQFFYEYTRSWYYPQNSKKDNKKHRLTHSGGLVFSQPKTSIHKLHDLARDLAEHVKNIASDKDENSGRKNNWFDYLILESIDYPTQALNQFWEQRYGSNISEGRGPLKALDQSYSCLADLKSCLAKNQLYQLVTDIMQQEKPDQADTSRLESLLLENQNHIKAKIPACKEIPNSPRSVFQTINGILNQHFSTDNSNKEDITFNPWSWIHFLELWDFIPTAADDKHSADKQMAGGQ